MYASFFDELEKIAEATGAPEKSNLKRNLAIGGAALGTLALGLGVRKGLKIRASNLRSNAKVERMKRSSERFNQVANIGNQTRREAHAARVARAKAADAADAKKAAYAAKAAKAKKATDAQKAATKARHPEWYR